MSRAHHRELVTFPLDPRVEADAITREQVAPSDAALAELCRFYAYGEYRGSLAHHDDIRAHTLAALRELQAYRADRARVRDVIAKPTESEGA